MKLGGCVVLYNPTDEVIENIGSYLPFLGHLVVLDNSDNRRTVTEALDGLPKIEVVNMGGNKGIASALNAACKRLLELGYDTVLTMDQDSVFPIENSKEILSLVTSLLTSHAIVGLNFNQDSSGSSDEVVEVNYWLTSGNFLRLDAFSNAGGFMDELFIDYVDIEFAHRLRLSNEKVCYLKNYSLRHEIGSPIEITVLGRTIHAMNHSPIRYYYRYRNSSYLYRTDRSFYFEKYWKEMLVNIPKMLLFEPHKGEKLKMVFRGLIDGKRGILGPYQGVSS